MSSLYRVASVSKTVTSAAINKLIDQGKLNLDSKVFGLDGVLGRLYGTQPYTAGVENITIRQLLSHSAGLPDNGNVFSFTMTTPEIMATVVNGQIGMSGTFAYSNVNFYILGCVIDKLAGGPNWTVNDPRNYESWVTPNVLAPSGIQFMSIGANTLAGRKANEVTYNPASDAYTRLNMTGIDAFGGWIASPIDSLRFVTHIDGTPTVPDILLNREPHVRTAGARLRARLVPRVQRRRQPLQTCGTTVPSRARFRLSSASPAAWAWPPAPTATPAAAPRPTCRQSWSRDSVSPRSPVWRRTLFDLPN